MRTPPKVEKRLCKPSEQSENVENELKVTEEIRHVTNFIKIKLWVLSKLRLLRYPCTASGLSLLNLRYFASTPKGAVAFCYSPFQCLV